MEKKKSITDYSDKGRDGLARARVTIVPFGFEISTTYGHGTNRGPAAIIKANEQVELFDEELWQETNKKIEIEILSEDRPAKNFIEAKKRMNKLIAEILKNGRLPIILGGEHSITPFIVEAFRASGQKDFSILQFDAHADLRDGYLREKFSHAAAMRRCLDIQGINLVQIGIRNISNENDELTFWENNQDRI